MLRSVKVVGDEWRVLVVDDLTVKVFSAACKLSDVTEESVSRACTRRATRRTAQRRASAHVGFAARACFALPRLTDARRLRRPQLWRTCPRAESPCRTWLVRLACRKRRRSPAQRLTRAFVLSDAAIYFISPTDRSVRQLIEDFAGPLQMYKKAHVFFSNRASATVRSTQTRSR